MVNAAFDSMGITDNTPFWVLYVILTFLMIYSGLVFQSKTIRTMIFVPISMASPNGLAIRSSASRFLSRC